MSGEGSYRVAVIGSDTLRGREIQEILSARKFPLKTIEFYDPDVEEEYSKLCRFEEEAKVVHHLAPAMLHGLDLVFLASDQRTNLEYGRLAGTLGFRAIDLSETFNDDPGVPLVVAGLNDRILSRSKAHLTANPSPVTIIMSHLLYSIHQSFRIKGAFSVVMEPVSVYEEKGIQELADQSMALLGSSAMPKKVFRGQVAFNLLSHVGRLDKNGYSGREKRILSEIKRVLGNSAFPFSLSIILAPVFHGYSIMTYVETETKAGLAALKDCLDADPFVDASAGGPKQTISSVSVAGRDKIFIGLIKKEVSIPRAFWIWAVADNLTLGSAINAYGIARAMFGLP